MNEEELAKYRKGLIAVLWRFGGRQSPSARHLNATLTHFIRECRLAGITTADIKKIRNHCASRFQLTDDSKSAFRNSTALSR